MSTTNGGPAFPVQRDKLVDLNSGSEQDLSQPGMSLRDYFAAQAITGLIGVEGLKPGHLSGAAGFAYELADAMLKARA